MSNRDTSWRLFDGIELPAWDSVRAHALFLRLYGAPPGDGLPAADDPAVVDAFTRMMMRLVLMRAGRKRWREKWGAAADDMAAAAVTHVVHQTLQRRFRLDNHDLPLVVAVLNRTIDTAARDAARPKGVRVSSASDLEGLGWRADSRPDVVTQHAGGHGRCLRGFAVAAWRALRRAEDAALADVARYGAAGSLRSCRLTSRYLARRLLRDGRRPSRFDLPPRLRVRISNADFNLIASRVHRVVWNDVA